MTLFQKLSNLSSDAWSWRWHSNYDCEKLAYIHLILTFVILSISWYAWTFTNSTKKRDPPMPPGPRGLPVVGNLLSLKPELHTYFANLSQTYGPILRLMLGKKVCVVVTSPAVAREVLKDHDTVFANRDGSTASTIMSYGGRDLVFSPYGPEWRMLRKVCVHDMLNSATLDAVYSLRRQEIRNTIVYLYSQAGSPINVGEKIFLTLLNVITNMLWGGTIQGKEKDAIGVDLRQVIANLTDQLGKPDISDFFPGLAPFDLQGITKKMRESITKLEHLFDKIIDQRRKMDGLHKTYGSDDTGEESKDFLQVLLQLEDEGKAKSPLTLKHVKGLLTDLVVGGTDTTSNAIEFIMTEIMNKPAVMKRVQQELDTVVGKDNIVDESYINKLPYLHAVMKEVLRLHPVVPLLVPHCPSESCVVRGYTIPKGARVLINVWAIHRDPSIWEKPLEFDPERFLNGKGDYRGNDFTYFPFGSGRRICVGIALAERMMMFSLASLLHSFDWKLPAGEKLDLSEKFGIVLKKKVPLIAIPTPRLFDPVLYE